jgi:hypothetical protein
MQVTLFFSVALLLYMKVSLAAGDFFGVRRESSRVFLDTLQAADHAFRTFLIP